MQGNSFFGFSGGGGSTPPPVSNGWLLNGNAEGAEKYFGTNDNFSIPIYTNGSAIGVFLNTGDFGFGTITPTSRVHIKGVSATSANYALKVDNSASSPLLYVRNDGNVGIGIAPSIADTKLEIKVATNQRFLFRNFTYPSIGATLTLQAINDAATDVVNVVTLGLDWYHASRNNLFSNFSNTIIPTAKVHIIGNNAGSDLFALKVDNGVLSPLLYVRNDGNVGIGTITPTAKLDVNGQIVSGLGGGVVTSNDSPFYAVRANTGAPNYYTGWQYTFEVGGGIWGIGMNYVNNQFQFLTNGASTGKFIFGDGNPATPNGKFLMDLNGGYFGSNTTSPTANIHAKGIDATSSNYALKLDNSASSPLLYVRNDGNVYAYGIGSISSNTSFGLDNLLSNTTGDYNTVYGVDAMRSNTIGRINVAIGHSAMRNSVGAGDYNIAVGFQALYANNGGTAIVAVGFQSHISNTTGSQNTAVGYQTLKSNTTGYNNNAIGHSALLNNIIGNNNSGYGIETLKNTNADNNTALGASAGRYNVSGTGNVFIGYNAGLNETLSNKLYISNSGTANPLIYGDFGTGLFRVNSNGAHEDTIGNTVNTIDATANVTAQTISVATNTVISIESTIVYRKTGGAGVGTTGDGTTIKLNSSVKNVAGTLTLDTVQNTYTGTVNAIVGAVANYTISGTNVLVSVTGVLNDNITWNVITKVNTVA